MNELHCPKCRRPVPEQAVNTTAGMALCGACAEVFRLPPPVTIQQQPVRPCPKGITISEDDQTLCISMRGFKGGYLVALLFILPMLLMIAGMIITSWDSLPIIGWLGIGVSSPVLLVCVYFCYVNIVSRIEISVTRKRLSVQHNPDPLSKSLEINVADIDQIYCTLFEGEHPSENTYDVNCLTLDGASRRLINVQETAQAYFIEHAIERFLGIEDCPVFGEMRSLNARRR